MLLTLNRWLTLALLLILGGKAHAVGLADSWVKSSEGTASEVFEIQGTGNRSNPLRRALAKPFSGDQLFVDFHLEYDAGSIDLPSEGDGEFFVLWMDEVEGDNAATHSGNVPNVGIHTDGESNRFMARYHSGGEAFATELKGGQSYHILARIWKSQSGKDLPFDRLDLWVNPKSEEEHEPQVTRSSSKAPATLRWIGFSTGRKTEAGDRIRVKNIRTATQWDQIPGLSSVPLPDYEVAEPNFEPVPEELAEVRLPDPDLSTDHWSFKPVIRPEVPQVEHADRVRTPVDAFIMRKQEEMGLQPAPKADPWTLRRRISLVLTGLPPEPDPEVQDLDAWGDELLTSQAFGERWARHWLDVARFAESNGHQHNRNRPHAWRYRDYVVRSFQENKPWDQFVREQLAGDELPELTQDGLIGTGFLAAARYSGNEMDKVIQRNDILVDVVNTTSRAFLGLTMECAQCHDHFFDPTTAWDYYRMQAIFHQGQPGNVILEEGAAPLIEERWRIFDGVRARREEELRAKGHPEPVLVIPKSVVKFMRPHEKKRFDELEAEIATYPQAWAWYSPITSPHAVDVAPHEMRWPLQRQKEVLAQRQTYYLDRGDVGTPGPVVGPAWPQVLGGTPEGIEERPRLAFANWLTNGGNPLTARVWVNRIWQGYFGRGLVETSGDFGVQGSGPTHPELLDWLASELVESGWDSRHIHQLILGSATFRQSSQFLAANVEADPAGIGYTRWIPRRLESEAIRDSILQVAGNLNGTVGGPSISETEADISDRRSLYLRQKRDGLPEQQLLFDSPNAVTSCSRRQVSTVALQPLWMLNSPFMQKASAQLAEREPELEKLIWRSFSRPPETEELSHLRALKQDLSTQDAALVLLNSSEFIYIP